MKVPVIRRVNRRTAPAVLGAVLAVTLAACGQERSYDNPPEVPVGTVGTTTTAAPTTTVFVPRTAPTTLAPSTNPPPPPTEAPTFAPQTAPPTQATIPTSPVPTTGERYAVVQGDTLFGISQKLNVRLPVLLAANGLNENSLIVPGQQLSVPQGGSLPAPQPTQPPRQTAPPAATAAPPAATAAPPAATAAPAPPTPTQAPAPTQPATPRPTTTFAAPPGGVVPRETSGSCQSPNSTEADGTPIVFGPGNVLDRNPATAWRCEAGEPQTLSFTFDGPTHLTSVGLIGGYVKVDPLTGVDRFPQNRRVKQVRWTFSDGSTVVQDLADSRSMQTINVNVTTTSATMEVLATYPQGGPDPRNAVPVAEVQFVSG